MNSSESPKPAEYPAHETGLPELPFRFPAGRFGGYADLQAGITALSAHPDTDTEEAFHPFERSLTVSNAPLILEYVRLVYDSLVAITRDLESAYDPYRYARTGGIRTPDQALSYRHIVVPLAYRLGFYTVAPKIAQASFEYLFPSLDRMLTDTIESFVRQDKRQMNAAVHQRFYWDNLAAYFPYSRAKSNHSVWRKLGSALRFREFTPEDFRKRVNDYAGMLWMMNVNPGENRFDAVVNGLREFAADGDIFSTVRTISVNLRDGFPVIMARGVWNGIPVETQFLGGDIIGWLAAMDYGKYKAGTTLDDIEFRLPPETWLVRGNRCLDIYEHEIRLPYYEEGRRPAFHEMLLAELLGQPVDYSARHQIEPVNPAHPVNRDNREFRLPGMDIPVWQQTKVQIPHNKGGSHE